MACYYIGLPMRPPVYYFGENAPHEKKSFNGAEYERKRFEDEWIKRMEVIEKKGRTEWFFNMGITLFGVAVLIYAIFAIFNL